MNEQSARQSVEHFRATFDAIKGEVQKFMVGQETVVEDVLCAIVCGGHVLLEGVPGLGKTSLAHRFANALHLQFKRIQFTPDLLPADVVGSNILVERGGEKVFQF